jgi:hypothetical protein
MNLQSVPSTTTGEKTVIWVKNYLDFPSPITPKEKLNRRTSNIICKLVWTSARICSMFGQIGV